MSRRITDHIRPELGDALPRRRTIPQTYFVGRRPFEAPELYAVTRADVERLRSAQHHAEPALDWRGDDAAQLELSDLLLARVLEPTAPRELTVRFARSVLAALPEEGFVIDADAVWGWVLVASGSEERSSNVPRLRRSWLAGLLTSLRRHRRAGAAG